MFSHSERSSRKSADSSSAVRWALASFDIVAGYVAPCARRGNLDEALARGLRRTIAQVARRRTAHPQQIAVARRHHGQLLTRLQRARHVATLAGRERIQSQR